MFVKNICFILFLFLAAYGQAQSVFDNIKWKKERELPNIRNIKNIKNVSSIKVYSNTFKKKESYYKAETVVRGVSADKLYNNLLVPDKYTKMFSRTILFRIIGKYDDKKYLIYSQLDFSPYENRDFYIDQYHYMTEDENNMRTYFIEWDTPAEEYPQTEGFVRAVRTRGRWTIKEISGNEVLLSIEYSNDWGLDVGFDLQDEIEKISTVRSIGDLVKYTFDNK